MKFTKQPIGCPYQREIYDMIWCEATDNGIWQCYNICSNELCPEGWR